LEDAKDTAATAKTENAPALEELVERADELVAEASALKDRYRELQDRLEALAVGPGPPSGEPARASVPDPAQSARTAATNLVLGGASREEVEAYLHQTFDSQDHEAILDELFQSADRRKRRRFVRRR
jgi:hypothetical protein